MLKYIFPYIKKASALSFSFCLLLFIVV